MNEIEKKFFDGFRTFVSSNPKIQIKGFGGGISNDTFEIIYDRDDDLENEFLSKDEWVSTEFLLKIDWHNSEIRSHITLESSPDPIDGYKPDFILCEPGFGVECFAIEIDGHEWHEKTKEQAANDRRKDRVYLRNGITPIRFTGTEVFHDAIGCAREALEIMARRISEIQDYYYLGRDAGETIMNNKIKGLPYFE